VGEYDGGDEMTVTANWGLNIRNVRSPGQVAPSFNRCDLRVLNRDTKSVRASNVSISPMTCVMTCVMPLLSCVCAGFNVCVPPPSCVTSVFNSLSPPPHPESLQPSASQHTTRNAVLSWPTSRRVSWGDRGRRRRWWGWEGGQVGWMMVARSWGMCGGRRGMGAASFGIGSGGPQKYVCYNVCYNVCRRDETATCVARPPLDLSPGPLPWTSSSVMCKFVYIALSKQCYYNVSGAFRFRFNKD
jgi:hypothetical protein